MSNKKLNSLFIAAWYPHEEKHYFGIFIKEHAEAVSLFCNVVVVYLRFQKRGFMPKIRIKKEQSNEITAYHLIVSSPIRKFGLHDYLVKRAFQKICSLIQKERSIDVVHINVRDNYTKQFTEINRLQELPIIVSEHFSFYHTGINNLSTVLQAIEEREINSWFSNPRIKQVLPVSKNLGNILSNEFGVSSDIIKIVPNIAGNQFYYSQKSADEIIKIALVANWQKPKNPMLFLKSLLDLKELLYNRVEIDWVGAGNQLNEITKYYQRNLAEYRIQFWGFQKKEFIGDVLRSADFLVHPTDAENLPTIIIESLCCGTPVLTNEVNGIPELLDHTNGIMSAPGSVKEFRKNLVWMVEQCRSFDNVRISQDALSKYSKEVISSQLEEVYNEVVLKRN